MRASSARSFFFGGIAHHANFHIQLHQARFDLRQPAPRFLAGLLRLLHRFLDRRRAGAEAFPANTCGPPRRSPRQSQQSSTARSTNKHAAGSIPVHFAISRTDADCLNSAVLVFFFSGGFPGLVRQLLREAPVFGLSFCRFCRRRTAAASAALPAAPGRAAVPVPRQNSDHAAAPATTLSRQLIFTEAIFFEFVVVTFDIRALKHQRPTPAGSSTRRMISAARACASACKPLCAASRSFSMSAFAACTCA